jgi:hypothetical protein
MATVIEVSITEVSSMERENTPGQTVLVTRASL